MRLCRPRTLAGHVACGHPTLFDRPDGLAGHAVEYICVALLGKLHERPYWPPRHSDIHQGRSRREIVVPDVVVRDLVMPDLLARFEIEADDGIGEQIAAQAMTA